MAPAIYNPDGNIIQRHPTEAAQPIVIVIAGLICKAIGVEDTSTIFAIALVLSFVPAAITWIVNLIKSK